jgi:hypothetical protein
MIFKVHLLKKKKIIIQNQFSIACLYVVMQVTCPFQLLSPRHTEVWSLYILKMLKSKLSLLAVSLSFKTNIFVSILKHWHNAIVAKCLGLLRGCNGKLPQSGIAQCLSSHIGSFGTFSVDVANRLHHSSCCFVSLFFFLHHMSLCVISGLKLSLKTIVFLCSPGAGW